MRGIRDDILHAIQVYLLSHETDIAIGENDFGELKDVFTYLFGREPVNSLEKLNNDIKKQINEM